MQNVFVSERNESCTSQEKGVKKVFEQILLNIIQQDDGSYYNNNHGKTRERCSGVVCKHHSS